MFRKILSEAEQAWFRPFFERAGSEAEIGSSDFHAGEIACGFIEQLPEEATLVASNFFLTFSPQKLAGHIGRARGPGLLRGKDRQKGVSATARPRFSFNRCSAEG